MTETEPGTLVVTGLGPHCRLAVDTYVRSVTGNAHGASVADALGAVFCLLVVAPEDDLPDHPSALVSVDPLPDGEPGWRIRWTDPVTRESWHQVGDTAEDHQTFIEDAVRGIFLRLDIMCGRRRRL